MKSFSEKYAEETKRIKREAKSSPITNVEEKRIFDIFRKRAKEDFKSL